MAKKSSAKKKSTPKKKATAKAKGVAKAKPTTRPRTGEKKKPVSMAELVLKKFGHWQPETPFQPAPDEGYLRGFSAPAFSEDAGKATAFRENLSRVFDFSAFPENPVSLAELVRKEFGHWQPETPFSPAPDEAYLKGFSAPAFSEDAGRATAFREILSRVFHFSAFPEEAEAVEKEPLLEKKAKRAVSQDASKPAKGVAEADAPKSSAPMKGVAEADGELEDIQDTAKKVVKLEEVKIRKLKLKKEEPAHTSPVTEQAKKEKVTDLPIKKGVEPMDTTMKYSAVGLVILVVIILGVSFSNASKYYLKPAGNGVEIWQGSFAPLDEELLIALPGIQVPKSIQSVYTREEIYPFAFDYYVQKADALLEAPSVPDYQASRAYLNTAISYGTKGTIRKAYGRLKKLDVIVLMNKADIMTAKGTAEGFEKALKYLEKAALLEKADLLNISTEGNQTELIKGKIDVVKNLKASLEPKPAEATSTPSEPAE